MIKFLSGNDGYVILNNEAVIGYYTYEVPSDGNEAEILGIVIAPDFQNKGFGTAIMEKIVSEIKNNPQIKSIKLVTHPENSGAIRFYWSFGFKIVDWLPEYYDKKPRLVMRKTL
ncbi:GNAT family N-acetyltransferase [Candidatus Dojkabacteria bacterium]|nr:GNAT family N-acetyltransferase [Candidatus Dojkabacteria bacterium]